MKPREEGGIKLEGIEEIMALRYALNFYPGQGESDETVPPHVLLSHTLDDAVSSIEPEIRAGRAALESANLLKDQSYVALRALHYVCRRGGYLAASYCTAMLESYDDAVSRKANG